MNGSSALNSINSRISKLFRFACVASIIAALIAGSFVLPASASEVDTSDWLDLPNEFHLYTDLGASHFIYDCELQELYRKLDDPNPYINSSFTLGDGDPLEDPILVVASTKLPIYQDSTYKLSYRLFGVSALSEHTYDFTSFTSYFPTYFSDIYFDPEDQTPNNLLENSSGVRYESLVDITLLHNESTGRFIGFEVVFSTADGYIDNLPSGDFVLNNSFSIFDDSGVYTFNITALMCSVISDPGAEYYLELSKQHQNELVDATVDTVTNAKSYLDQITVFDNISSTKDQLASSISSAASWFSPLARSGDSLVSAAGTVNTIYESVMNNTHSYCGMLVTVIPVLCFFKWLMSMVLRF